MQHDPLGSLLREDPEGVVPRVPDVDDERFTGLAGQGDVGPERSLLILWWRKPPVIVETRFAHAHDQRVGQQLLDHGPGRPVELRGGVRVDPGRGEHTPKGLGHLEGLPTALRIDAHTDQAVDPGSPSGPDGGGGIALHQEEVAVRVDR
jgi:hypothetical protein